jgi:hypothetical protein
LTTVSAPHLDVVLGDTAISSWVAMPFAALEGRLLGGGT